MGDDFVCVGRALLREADFVHRLQADPDHVSDCTRCNRCVATMSDPGGTRCVLNA
jgi:2,4-dienoyl-CoA reductase-like NADH-dependent reductase (Old Yellow Enzyme family)